MRTLVLMFLNITYMISVGYTIVGGIFLIFKIFMPDKVIVDNPWPFILAAIVVIPLHLVLRKVNQIRRLNNDW
jgi:hypothetical protein